MIRMLILTVVAAVMMSVSSDGFCWGKNGHRIIAQIATNHISASTTEKIKELLGEQSLPRISTWADEIRSLDNWDYSKSWHYANMDNSDYLNSKINKKGDVVIAVLKCEDILRNPKSDKISKINALKFLVHFVGDMHQPMHMGTKSSRGGNNIKVTWFKNDTNLHKVWDDHLIDFMDLSYSEYTAFLDINSKDEQKDFSKGTIADWANQISVVSKKIFKFSSRKLEYKYITVFKDDMELQIRRAGIRLAATLDKVFSSKPLTDEEKKLRKTLYSKVDDVFKI